MLPVKVDTFEYTFLMCPLESFTIMSFLLSKKSRFLKLLNNDLAAFGWFPTVCVFMLYSFYHVNITVCIKDGLFKTPSHIK